MIKRFLFLLLFPFCLFAKEQTLAIIKPEIVASHHIGDIISHYEKGDLQIAAIKIVHLTKAQAAEFYKVHQSRPFYDDLVAYLSSGPIAVLILEGDNAVIRNRELMGATDPKKAKEGTIRSKWGTDIQKNAVHGSDSKENAATEIAFFFST